MRRFDNDAFDWLPALFIFPVEREEIWLERFKNLGDVANLSRFMFGSDNLCTIFRYFRYLDIFFYFLCPTATHKNHEKSQLYKIYTQKTNGDFSFFFLVYFIWLFQILICAIHTSIPHVYNTCKKNNSNKKKQKKNLLMVVMCLTPMTLDHVDG